MFDVLDMGASGLVAQRTRMDTIAANILHVNTTHNEKGEPIKEQWLKGTELPFKAAVPMPWADKSVNIAGLPGWEHDAAVKFFMTGIAYNRLPARPPMPQYRYNRQDAEAIVAYLKSLAPAK